MDWVLSCDSQAQLTLYVVVGLDQKEDRWDIIGRRVDDHLSPIGIWGNLATN